MPSKMWLLISQISIRLNVYMLVQCSVWKYKIKLKVKGGENTHTTDKSVCDNQSLASRSSILKYSIAQIGNNVIGLIVVKLNMHNDKYTETTANNSVIMVLSVTP